MSLCASQNRRDLQGLATRAGAGTVLGLLVLAVGVGSCFSQVLVWYDSGLHHLQVIKWLSRFGLVPGLALFHSRLGVISSWFALPAPLNHGFLQGRISALPGALGLLLLLSHLARLSSGSSVAGEEHPQFNFLLPPHVWKFAYDRNPTTGTIETFKGTISRHRTGRVKYYRSKYSNACWDAPLPCSPYQLQNLKFRLPAEGLSAGVEKINPELLAEVGPG